MRRSFVFATTAAIAASLSTTLLAGTALAQAASQPAAATASAPAAPAVTEEAVDNPYGLKALWEQGDFVAKGTLVIMVIMSMGSWYVIFTKLIEQRQMLKSAKASAEAFWKAQLAALIARYQPDEIMLTGMSHDHAKVRVGQTTLLGQEQAEDRTHRRIRCHTGLGEEEAHPHRDDDDRHDHRRDQQRHDQAAIGHLRPGKPQRGDGAQRRERQRRRVGLGARRSRVPGARLPGVGARVGVLARARRGRVADVQRDVADRVRRARAVEAVEGAVRAVGAQPCHMSALLGGVGRSRVGGGCALAGLDARSSDRPYPCDECPR